MNDKRPAIDSPNSLRAEHLDGCSATAVAFDFAEKTDACIAVAQVHDAIREGKFVWLDIEVTNAAEAKEVLAGTQLVSDDLLDDALRGEPGTQLARYEDHLHLVLTACLSKGEHFDLQRVDAVIAETFLLTIHRERVGFVECVKKDCRADFVRFAKSPSFLVYELWDNLVDGYMEVQREPGGARRAPPGGSSSETSTIASSRACPISAPTSCTSARSSCPHARC